MINLPNKDRVIFEMAYRVSDIINEYQTTGKVGIATNNEGLCLQSAKFYPLLDYICKQFDIAKSNVTIITNNIEEGHDQYTIRINGDHWISASKSVLNWRIHSKQQELKHVGCFIGKPNWHRMITSAWLYNMYQDLCLQTIHYDPTSLRHRIDAELTEINIEAPAELDFVIGFIKNCPLTLDEGFLNYTIGPPTHYNIINSYQHIFVDLVVETYVSGLTFFPTEKTLRPIIASTPFIIMGPKGYLSNLQRIGFKTFSNWWDESYDEFSNYERILAIRQVLLKIFQMTQLEIHHILIEMAPVLTHNRQHLQQLNATDIKLVNDK